jgi:L-lactate dehydrogenase complex protein LldG
MTTSIESREKILKEIRSAKKQMSTEQVGLEASYAALPRPYVSRGALSHSAVIELMVERLRDYDADVVECMPESIANTIAKQLKANSKVAPIIPPGLPKEWQASELQWTADHELSPFDVERFDSVVTGAFCGIADSGTIVLHHGPSEGKRLISLLPDWHLCVLFASQIVETLPEYFARVDARPDLVTWISGPSATADIEMTRIKGVHGPRFLSVVIVND